MKKVILFFAFCICAVIIYAQQQGQQQVQQPRPPQWDPASTEWYTPVPPKVQPGKTVGQPPSDAVILFDGKNLDKWESQRAPAAGSRTREAAPWKIENGEAVVVPGSGGIQTKEFFGDCQLHIEFKSPPQGAGGNGTGQNKGNSGIFLQNTYEVQVLDGDNNPTYVNGMVGSIYKQSAPLANAYTKNGEWQVYDIYWKAPKFDSNGVVEPAMITVVLNGIVVQNNYILKGDTPYTGLPKYTPHGRLPLSLQDHGEEVRFRNIWIRNL